MGVEWDVAAVLLLIGASTLLGGPRKATAPMPDHFEVGRYTFFDFGPPMDYYEIYSVRAADNRSIVDRITLTPGYDTGSCHVPTRVEFASATLNVSVPALLQSVNPCEIPDKVLKREEKRCKKCMTFSGAMVNVRVTCGDASRLIRMRVREEDWFDSRTNTPQNTTWSMRLLGQLDQALGGSIMDGPKAKQIIPGFGNPENELNLDWHTTAVRDLKAGAYDGLFPPPQPSVLAEDDLESSPTVSLVDLAPIPPDQATLPPYPRIARMAGVEGPVSFHFTVGDGGVVGAAVTIDKGYGLLQGAVVREVGGWKFPPSAAGQVVHGTIVFALNCKKKSTGPAGTATHN
jgi:Gram-negative bacterial TonB protein C-terminal